MKSCYKENNHVIHVGFINRAEKDIPIMYMEISLFFCNF